MIGAWGSPLFSHTQAGIVQQSFAKITQVQQFLPQADSTWTMFAILLATIASCFVLFFATNKNPSSYNYSYITAPYTHTGVFFAPQKEKARRRVWDDIL